MKAKTFRWVSFPIIAFIAALFLALTIACGIMSDTITLWLVKDKVDISEDELNATRQEGEKLAEQIEGEGIVMTKNDNVLPLSKSEDYKVNVFGWSVTQWITGGSGSGQVVNSEDKIGADTGLLEALEAYDIDYNTDIIDMYRKYQGTRPYFNTSQGALHTYNYQFSRLYEPDLDSAAYYSHALLSEAELFSDTAIVVIGRVSGESNDAPTKQFKGVYNSSSASEDASRHYLEISTEEEKLLKFCGERFEKVIVVVNAVNTMELGFMDTIPGLDACLIVGGTGTNAATAIPKVLYGEITPSGRLTDTYAYGFESAASFANAGENGTSFYTNGKGLYPADGTTTNGNVSGTAPKYDGVSYMDYSEGIYVGYKWYETADTEKYWAGVDNAYGKGYEGVVQYPFGYGQSYTSFSKEIVQLSPAAGEKLTKDGKIEVKVRVTNTGTVKGQEVVQLYYTPPYQKDGIEKASVNLAAFAKTHVLEPGISEDLTLSFKVEDMASYDCYDKNGNGFKGYELESGKYYIKLMENSHELSQVEVRPASAHKSAAIEYNVEGGFKYETDTVTGEKVENKFTGDKAIDGVSLDGSDSDANITYLSRSDFKGTFPAAKKAARAMADNVKEQNLYTSEMAEAYKNPADADIKTGEKNGLMVYGGDEVTALGLELGGDFEHADWDNVLNQLTVKEMQELVLHGYVKTKALGSIGKPLNRDADGPAQIGSFNMGDKHGTGFPNTTVLAQTFNPKLSYSFGLAVGKEAGALGYDGWYAPAVNIHRSPFGGRNFEYYSEDSLLSGIMSANTIRGAKNTGVYTYIKHLALYEQETARDGLYVWLTEQAMREIYLKPFKICIDEGGASGIMSAYGRVGAVWTGGSKAMLQGVLRDEWGFNGTVITDYSDHHKFMNIDQALRAGADLWMDGFGDTGKFMYETSSNSFKQALRTSSKRIVYTWLNALYTNSQYNAAGDVDPIIKVTKTPGFPWWIPVLAAADVIAFGGCAVWAFFAVKKKDKQPQQASSN